MKTFNGKFKPKHPEKYKGNPTLIFYRSSWELKVMLYLDSHPGVLEWSSEEIRIQYVSPVDSNEHTYFPDFWVRTATKTMIIEVKPFKQTIEPKKQTRKTKRYILEVFEWGKNSAKWEAARVYAASMGWTFKLITERELGIPGAYK